MNSQSLYSNDQFSLSPMTGYSTNYYAYNNSNQSYDSTHYNSILNYSNSQLSSYQNMHYYNSYHNYPNYSYVQDSANYSLESSSSYYSSSNVSPYLNYRYTAEPIVKQSTPSIDSFSSQVFTGFIEKPAEKPASEVKTKSKKKSGRNLEMEFDTDLLHLLQENEGKRARTSFTLEQRHYLLSVFEKSIYPSKEILETIANKFNVKSSVIQTWFKNTRSKQKKLTNTKNLF